jgi:hypothetical protein
MSHNLRRESDPWTQLLVSQLLALRKKENAAAAQSRIYLSLEDRNHLQLHEVHLQHHNEQLHGSGSKPSQDGTSGQQF